MIGWICTGFVNAPSTLIRPLMATHCSACASVSASPPTVSTTTSTPPVSFASAATPSFVASYTASAPSASAIAFCCGCRAVAATYVAPIARAAAIAVSPIVPLPSTATRSPNLTSTSRNPCTLTVSGSSSAPSSKSMASGSLYSVYDGSAWYSRSPPGAFSPNAFRDGQCWYRPVRQYAHVRHTLNPSMATRSPTAKPRHAFAERFDLAGALMARDEPGWQRELAAEEVQVAATHADLAHPHEHLARARLRHVDILDLDAAGSRQRCCFHRMLRPAVLPAGRPRPPRGLAMMFE